MTASVPHSLALISNSALCHVIFRGPLIRDLVAQGVAVYALAPDFDPKLRSKIRALGAEPVDISMDRVGTRAASELRDLWALCTIMRRLRPDATLSYFLKPVIYGGIAAKLAGVPRRFSLIEGLGYQFTTQKDEGWPRKLLRTAILLALRVVLRFSDRVFLLNSDDYALLVSKGIVSQNRARNIGGIGVDLEEFQSSPIPPGIPTFLFVGRFLREKGVYEFVQAAEQLRREGVKARFVLLGAVDVNPGSVSLHDVEEWLRNGIVEWPGWIEDIRPWLAQSTVFVLPSYREGLPRSTQEAMAAGRAVITTDQPGCRETVINGVNGFQVPARDALALADAMKRFISEPELAIEMGQASRRLAEELYDVRKINARVLAELGVLPGGRFAERKECLGGGS